MNTPETHEQIEQRLQRITARILTVDGQEFDFLAPANHRIDVGVIAHALANICRFTGHCRAFYSVAQHSVLVSNLVRNADGSEAPPALKLQALLHDAAEAFVGDVSGPLKRLLPEYKEIERRVERAVLVALGMPEQLPAEVKYADLVALRIEQKHLMHKSADGTWDALAGINPNDYTPECFTLRPLAPEDARDLFLARYVQLDEQRAFAAMQ